MTNAYVVTGGSKGIGLAVVKRLLSGGHRVICLSRTPGALPLENPYLTFVECDLTSSQNRHMAFTKTLSELSSLSGIVNNCAGPKPEKFESTSTKEYHMALDSHLFAADELLRMSLPALKSSGEAKIANIVSVTARSPLENLMSSNLLRGAIINWAKTLSIELAPYNINVNNVLPGYTLTKRLEEVLASKAENQKLSMKDVQQELIKDIPLKRFGSPDEIANVVHFLLSKEASYITGVSIPVDGGWTKSV